MSPSLMALGARTAVARAAKVIAVDAHSQKKTPEKAPEEDKNIFNRFLTVIVSHVSTHPWKRPCCV